jgi:hypothetical protein
MRRSAISFAKSMQWKALAKPDVIHKRMIMAQFEISQMKVNTFNDYTVITLVDGLFQVCKCQLQSVTEACPVILSFVYK